jgi:acyl-CoA reductase-like NAD-dependent aldehyde dehydrogenase
LLRISNSPFGSGFAGLGGKVATSRIGVLKTYKLFVGGKFPRSESGRTRTAVAARSGQHLAHYCRGSKKDVREAVVSARAAVAGWASATAYLRGQILYRAAEMIEGRAASFAAVVTSSTGLTPAAARREIEAAADRLVHFAGWSDKIAQVFGTVNPVASPHFNFSTPEPAGVVVVIAPDEPSLLGFIDAVAPVVVAGNAVVALASEKFPLPAMELAEALATSDLPGGVINILTGRRTELAPTFATHMDVNAIVDASGDPAIRELLHQGTAKNLKRVTFRNSIQADGYSILDTIEWKTVWHPIGY